MHQKYAALKEYIRKYDKVAVCLSGGSSSALVTIAAVDVLGTENVVAITANTPFFTGEELLSSKVPVLERGTVRGKTCFNVVCGYTFTQEGMELNNSYY